MTVECSIYNEVAGALRKQPPAWPAPNVEVLAVAKRSRRESIQIPVRAGLAVLSRAEVSPTGCWIDQGHPSQRYAAVWDNERRNTMASHVAVWELMTGQRVRDGEEVHHRCKVRRCVRPSHLMLLAAAEHRQLHSDSPRTHCMKGHEFTPENTIVRYSPHYQRICRLCLKAKYQRAWQRLTADQKAARREANRRFAASRQHPCADCGTPVSPKAERCRPCYYNAARGKPKPRR